MKPGQRVALIHLLALSAGLSAILAAGYRQIPAPGTSVHIAVRFVDVDDAFMEEIGVNLKSNDSTIGDAK